MNGVIGMKKTKKGFMAEIVGTPLQLSEFSLAESDHGKECTYEVVSGRVAKLAVAGQDRPKKSSQKPPQSGGSGGHYPGNQKGGGHSYQHDHQVGVPSTARAPYNFIPLNDRVAGFENAPAMNRYDKNRHSGHIVLNIETITPLYIRGTSPDMNRKTNANSNFFSPGNRLKIPGSSIRGMIRELIEIVSFGKFHCDDRQLFFRNIGDPFYRDTMIDMANNCFPKARAGILTRDRGRYYIQPSDTILGTEHYRINGRFSGNDFTISGITSTFPQFTFHTMFFKPVSPSNYPHTDSKGKERLLRYAKVTDISETNQPDYTEGYLVVSGKFASKKHMQWIVNKAGTADRIKIPESVIEQYKNDVTRDEQTDLLKMLQKHSEVPCFYLTDSAGQIKAFGHTGLFRHPYQLSVHDHLDPILIDERETDCAEAIFGKLEHWAGRVFFEDVNLEPDQSDVLMPQTSPKILSGPKPTTFQHYLTSENGRAKDWGNQSAGLAGYKLYWHRNTMQQDQYHWSEGRVMTDSQHTCISPIRDGIRFFGRIRFDNLSDEELGALLFVLNLPENCCHKLGMGKPLGLGTVKITSRLVLDNREERYRSLFDDTGWALPQKPDDQNFADEFATDMLRKLKRIDATQKGNAAQLWKLDRLQALKTMLDWENTKKQDWNEKTRYMEIEHGKTRTTNRENEYRGRHVLPDPISVVT